jgi:outer membrane protein assembly factor BamB
MSLQGMLFVGFNRRVAALDQETGDVLWDWKAPRGYGFVTMLLDVDRLFVSVQGYTYCLDAYNGQQLWDNPMKGFGTGTTCMASVNGHSPHELLGESAAQQAQAASAGGAAGATR